MLPRFVLPLRGVVAVLRARGEDALWRRWPGHMAAAAAFVREVQSPCTYHDLPVSYTDFAVGATDITETARVSRSGECIAARRSVCGAILRGRVMTPGRDIATRRRVESRRR